MTPFRSVPSRVNSQIPNPPCVTFRRVAVSLRGPGQSPVLLPCMLRGVAAVCRPLRLVLLLVVSFPRSPSPVVGVPGLCWLLRVPFVR